MKEPKHTEGAGYVLYFDGKAGTTAFLKAIHLFLDLMVIFSKCHSLPHLPTPKLQLPSHYFPSAEHYRALRSFLLEPK